MEKVCKKSPCHSFESKSSSEPRVKCQRNIWTLKMTESEELHRELDATLCETQKIEVETSESEVKNSQLETIKSVDEIKEMGNEIVNRTVECQEDNAVSSSTEQNDIEMPDHGVELNNSSQQKGIKKSNNSSLLNHKHLVIWRSPGLTLLYFMKELFIYSRELLLKLSQYHRVLKVLLSLFIIVVLLNTQGSGIPAVFWVQKKALWCLYWFSLGMLSSVGLGSGIHTFALYLGPYIASVTVAANECGYLNFVDDSQEDMGCPRDSDPRWSASLWNIMCKVRLESYMWGLGTAVGELPPYFMGRAARLSQQEERTEVIQEFEDLERRKDSPESLTSLDRIKLFVRDLVVKAGFWGILACASIPNPFFDLAGITCGNFLIPFWTFFGATLIGKAIIKTTIQQVLVILSFNKNFLEGVMNILTMIPLIGQRLEFYFSQYIVKQKQKFTKDRVDEYPSSGWFSKAYHIFVICTFLYFFISIINSLAQNHYKRLERKRQNEN